MGSIFLLSSKKRKWDSEIYFIAGFVALGFAGIENYLYLLPTSGGRDSVIQWVGRTFVSANIHLMVNLCFALFLIKSEFQTGSRKWILIAFGLFMAVFQHGLVDFFLIPGSKFGGWLAIWLFVGIWVWVAKDTRRYILSSPPQ